MLTFAGVPINGVPGCELDRLLALWWQHEGIREFDRGASVLGGILHLPLPPLPVPCSPRAGVLEWPNGASRWATFHAIVTGLQVAQLMGLSGQSGSLVINDGRSSISTTLTMLPPRTIGRHAGADFYLLTLVDDRFFWWQSVAAAPSSPSSWSALLTTLLNAVGAISPSIPTIPSAYGSPDANRWDVGLKALPLLIDAACATVGLKLVRGLDGSVALVGAATAISTNRNQWNAFSFECLLGGNAILPDSLQPVPEKVRVVFPGADAGATEETADVALVDLALAEYAGIAGHADAMGFIGADLIATADATARNAYAIQAATDYYLWAMPSTEATFRGVAKWLPIGLEERIEWSHQDTILTRVYRRPAADRNLYTSSPFAASSFAYTTDFGPPATDYIEIPVDGHTPTTGVTYVGTPLQPADGVIAGWVTGIAQEFGGDKTFANDVLVIGTVTVDEGLLGGAMGLADVSSGRDVVAARDLLAGRNVNATDSITAGIALTAPITYADLQGDTATINNLWFSSIFHMFNTTGIPLGGSTSVPILEIQGPNPSTVDIPSSNLTVSNGDVIAGFGVRGQIVYTTDYFECEETPGISATIIDARGNSCIFLGGILTAVTPPAGG